MTNETLSLEQVDTDGAMPGEHHRSRGGRHARRASSPRRTARRRDPRRQRNPGARGRGAHARSRSDVAILNFALTLEYLEAAFYTEAPRWSAVRRTGAVLARRRRARARPRRALKKVLGRRAVKKPRVRLPRHHRERLGLPEDRDRARGHRRRRLQGPGGAHRLQRGARGGRRDPQRRGAARGLDPGHRRPEPRAGGLRRARLPVRGTRRGGPTRFIRPAQRRRRRTQSGVAALHRVIARACSRGGLTAALAAVAVAVPAAAADGAAAEARRPLSSPARCRAGPSSSGPRSPVRAPTAPHERWRASRPKRRRGPRGSCSRSSASRSKGAYGSGSGCPCSRTTPRAGCRARARRLQRRPHPPDRGRAACAPPLRGGRTVFRARVGVGQRALANPDGRVFIRNKLTRYRSAVYGPVAFGTSARSAVLTDWPAGGFIGIHGTSQPGDAPRPGLARLHSHAKRRHPAARPAHARRARP